MISFVVRFFLSLVVLCSFLLGAALLIGTTIPIPAHVSLFTQSTCALPCVYGVRPGVTTRHQALQTFAPSSLSFSLLNQEHPGYALREADTARSMMVLVDFGSADSTFVRSIQIYQMSSRLDLGSLSDFMLAGFPPKRVYTGCQSKRVALVTLGEQDVYVETVLNDRLEPDNPVLLMGVASDDQELTQSIDQFGCSTGSLWTGFAASWKYES